MPRSDISNADINFQLYKTAAAGLKPEMRALIEALAISMAKPLKDGCESTKPEDCLTPFVAMRVGIEIHKILDNWDARQRENNAG